jgi:hypothetical protein
MSRARHQWTDEEHTCLVELLKNPLMVQQYKNEKSHFFKIVIDTINGLESNQYSGYVLLDELSVEAKFDNFLSNMKTYHKLEEPVLAPLLLVLCPTPALFVLIVNLMKLCILEYIHS